MSERSNASSAGLPHEGQAVQFVLDGRDVIMDGTYASRTFRSRWSGYEPERVTTWRPARGSGSAFSAQAIA